MSKEAISLGYKPGDGREFKIMRINPPGDMTWAVFERVNYPSGKLYFWQQVSKAYQGKQWAFKNMLKRGNAK